MSRSMALALCISFGLVALFSSPAERTHLRSEQETRFLNSEVRNFDNHGEPLVSTLLHISGSYRIPMGIEQVTPESLSRGIVVHLVRGTVAELLNLCLTQVSGYAWTTQDGAINIYGQKEWVDPANVFNLSIRSFTVTDATLNDANNHLRELVFTIAAISGSQGRAGEPAGMGGDSPGVGALERKRVSIAIQNKKVRNLLNHMVVLSESCGQQVAWVADLPPTELAKAAMGGSWKLIPVTGPTVTVPDKR